MAYLVKIASRAERDLNTLYEKIIAPDSTAAGEWYRGLRQAILSLAERPNRCPVAPENKRFRQLLYGTRPYLYRVIYHVNQRQRQFDVLHIRHGARRSFHMSDLKMR